MNEVKYLGTIVTPNGIKPDPAKVEEILGMPTPTDSRYQVPARHNKHMHFSSTYNRYVSHYCSSS